MASRRLVPKQSEIVLLIGTPEAGLFVVRPEGTVNINVRYWVEHEVLTLPQDVLLTMLFKQVTFRWSCPWSARVDLRTHGVLDEDEDQYNEEQDDNERCGIDAAAAATGLDRINA